MYVVDTMRSLLSAHTLFLQADDFLEQAFATLHPIAFPALAHRVDQKSRSTPKLMTGWSWKVHVPVSCPFGEMTPRQVLYHFSEIPRTECSPAVICSWMHLYWQLSFKFFNTLTGAFWNHPQSKTKQNTNYWHSDTYLKIYFWASPPKSTDEWLDGISDSVGRSLSKPRR